MTTQAQSHVTRASEQDHLFTLDPTRTYPVLARADGVHVWDTDGNRVPRRRLRARGRQHRLRPARGGRRDRRPGREDAVQRRQHLLDRAGDCPCRPHRRADARRRQLRALHVRRLGGRRGRAQDGAPVPRGAGRAGARQGDRALDLVPRRDAGRAVGRGRRPPAGQIPADAARHAPYPADLLLSLPVGPTYPSCQVTCAASSSARSCASGRTGGRVHRGTHRGLGRGAIRPQPEYFPKIREICDRYGVLLIVDEVITGFGRTGRNFGIEHYGVVPDLMVMGKGISVGVRAARRGRRHESTSARRSSSRASRSSTSSRRRLPGLHGGRDRGGRHPAARAAHRTRRGAGAGPRRRPRWPSGVPDRGRCADDRLHGRHRVRGRPRDPPPFPPASKVAVRVREAGLRHGIVTYPGTGMADGGSGDIISLYPPLTFTAGRHRRHGRPAPRDVRGRDCRPRPGLHAGPTPSGRSDPRHGPLGDHAARGRSAQRRRPVSCRCTTSPSTATTGRGVLRCFRAVGRCRRGVHRSPGPGGDRWQARLRAWATPTQCSRATRWS